jgi:membrane-associated phospholipid phosphatase
MLLHEWLALIFFGHLAVAALVRPLPGPRRVAAGGGSVLMATLVIVLARQAPPVWRGWVPVLYVLAGYYLAGRTFVAPMPRIESWLSAIDRRVLGDPANSFARWPPGATRVLDAAYISCFLLVPAGFALLTAAGRADLAERYWTIVAGSELGAFATLPYLQTRPPWVLERLDDQASGRAKRASVLFMKHATTGANTLPSGHAAGSLAVALAVLQTLPVAGAVLLILALAIAVATVVTRAHFVVDVVTGIALAVAVWSVVAIARI